MASPTSDLPSVRNPLQVRLAQALIREAEAYCATIEAVETCSRLLIVPRVLRRLSALQFAAVEAFTRGRLPTGAGMNEPRDWPVSQPKGLAEAARRMQDALHIILRKEDGYWFSWDPAEPPEDPTQDGPYRASVDMIDMYIDVRSVLAARALSPEYDDIWTATMLLVDYRYHWHRHLLGALSVLGRVDVRRRH